MTDFIGSVWWMIVSLGLLVTFHEFGHYWVGRLCGVKILRFGRLRPARRAATGMVPSSPSPPFRWVAT